MTPGRGAVARSALVAALLLTGCTDPGPNPVKRSGPSPISATTAAYPSFPPHGTEALPPDTVRKLQAVLDEALTLHAASPTAGARGVTAAVVSDRGSWTGAAGSDGVGARLHERAMMPIDSITKTFTAAEVLLLAQQGKVKLDAPFSSYVKETLTANGATVRDLLSMRSGIIDPPDDYEALARLTPTASGGDWTIRRSLAALKITASQPGLDPHYANANYLLLGLLVETLTGRVMPHVLRTDLFEPAHLTRIAAQDTERPTAPTAAPPKTLVPRPDGYLPSRAWTHATHDTFAGIAADAPTVALWGYELYGARLLGAPTVRAMTTPPSPGSLAPGLGYALGTMVFYNLSTDPTFGHVGSGPASTSILVVVPARRVSVAILAPEAGRDLDSMVRDLLHAFSGT